MALLNHPSPAELSANHRKMAGSTRSVSTVDVALIEGISHGP